MNKNIFIIVAILALILVVGGINGCSKKAQVPWSFFSGYLFSVDDNLYFVSASSVIIPEGVIEVGGVLTEDKIKELTGLKNIKPLLAKPEITSSQARSIAENKLFEIMSSYNTKLGVFTQETCVSECMEGLYCGEVVPSPGKETIPCPTSNRSCQQYCRQREIALNRGYDIYSNANLSKPLLFYDQYGNPRIYEIFCINGESLGVIFNIDAFSGDITPFKISVGDLLPHYISHYNIHPYSGLFKWDEITKKPTQSEAQSILQTYLEQQGIPGTILDFLYIEYQVKWS